MIWAHECTLQEMHAPCASYSSRGYLVGDAAHTWKVVDFLVFSKRGR